MRPEWSDRFRSALIAAVASLWAAVFGVAGSGFGRLGDPWSPWWPLLVAAAGGVAFAVPLFRSGHPVVAVYRLVCWSAAAGWVAWAYADGIATDWRHPNGDLWQAWLFGTLALAVLSLGFAVSDEAPGFLPGSVRMSAHAVWEERLARVGKAPGCTVTSKVEWPIKGTGYDVAGDCPDDGTSWVDLKLREQALAASMRLPKGCGVEVGPGEDSGGFRIRVATRDTLGEYRQYTDTSELSILRPVPFGWHRDGTVAEALLRSSCVMCVSETGGGKSNFLHTLVAGFVRCPDVLTWLIDLGGAGLALPWVGPWLDGNANSVPAVDWVAPDLSEALIMTKVALHVIKQRRVVYRDLMRDADADLVPVSAQVPQVEIVIDETAEAAGLTANSELQQNIVRIIQLGRAVGVRVVLSGLRATASVLPVDAQRQIGVRAVFGVGDEAEVGHALGWRTKLNLGEAPYPGAGWWRDGTAGGIQVFRTPHTAKPSTIRGIAAATSRWRTTLDDPSWAGTGSVYPDRWQRVVHLLGGLGGGGGGGLVAANRLPLVAQSDGMTTGSGDGSRGYDAAAVERKLRRARAAQAAERLRQMPAAYAAQEWERMQAELEDDRVAGDTEGEPSEAGRDRGKARALTLLQRAGRAGLSGAALLAGLREQGFTESDATLYRWVAEWRVPGRQLYVHPDHPR